MKLIEGHTQGLLRNHNRKPLLAFIVEYYSGLARAICIVKS